MIPTNEIKNSIINHLQIFSNGLDIKQLKELLKIKAYTIRKILLVMIKEGTIYKNKEYYNLT